MTSLPRTGNVFLKKHVKLIIEERDVVLINIKHTMHFFLIPQQNLPARILAFPTVRQYTNLRQLFAGERPDLLV